MRLLSDREQPLILELLGSCFPDYWEQLALKNGRMPFYEISFAEFDGTKLIGHCGIIPYDIYCRGKVFPMGGIASVVVDPAYRNRGIARDLCNFSADWAKTHGFISLPLYTAHFRVYESCRWQKLPVPSTLQFAFLPPPQIPARSKESLTEKEKMSIIALYESAAKFNGKVIRQTAGTLHSWERIFAEPEFTFSLIPGGYAIIASGVVIEANFAPDVRYEDAVSLIGNRPFYLPTVPEVLAGTEFIASTVDPMHGERPMFRDLDANDFHLRNRIFFPVTDKF